MGRYDTFGGWQAWSETNNGQHTYLARHGYLVYWFPQTCFATNIPSYFLAEPNSTLSLTTFD